MATLYYLAVVNLLSYILKIIYRLDVNDLSFFYLMINNP